MKTLTTILTLALITFSSVATAQDFEVPKTGAKIYMTNNSIDLAPETEYTFDLWIVRSNKAKKAKFDMPRFSGSDNLDITVEANPEDKDNYKVTVKAKNVTSGKYFYTIMSRTNGIQRINGTTASFNIGSQNMASSEKN